MPRTFTAGERLTVGARQLACYGKLEIQDADLVYRDYSALLSKDFLNAVTLSHGIDDNAMTLSGSLLPEIASPTTRLSLSPFRADSLINRNAGGSYATTLDLWRRWRVSTAIEARGYGPANWKEIGQGRIDVIDVGDHEIRIQGRSEDAILLDRWIATERSYGSVGGVAMETVLQQMLDDNLGSGVVTLYCPVSPSYLMNAWVQPKGSLMPALTAVAEKAGFILRYRYDASNVFRLTLFKPNRTATVEDWTLGASEYLSIGKCAIDLSGVRNFVKLRYVHSTLGTQTVMSPSVAGSGTVSCAAGAATFSASQAGVIANGSDIIVAGIAYTVSGFSGTTTCTLSSQLADGGVPTFGASVFAASGTSSSITAYDRRDIEIDLSFTSQVNDPTKAQGFADAVRQDLEFPNLAQEVHTIGFWFAQLYDYGRFLANGVQYDSDQLAGVTSVAHELANGEVITTLGVRGKPAGRYTTWRVLAQRTVPIGTDRLPLTVQPPTAYITPTASTVTADTVNFTGNVGKGGASPLSWQWRSTIGGSAPGAWSSWAAATGGNALPFSQAITRHAKWATVVEFQTRDANSVLSPIASYTVDSRTDFLDDTTGSPRRTRTWDDGVYALSATENNGTTKSSSAHNPQGSVIPATTDASVFSYTSRGPSNGNMSVSWTWSAITLYLADGTTISIPASSSLATPPSPTLSQVVSGALAGRTRFVRIAYVKNTLMYHIGAEASLAISANNLLKVTSPSSVAGYDGWMPLVGTASNAEFFQPINAVAFGTDWTEPVTGADFTVTPYDNATMPNAVTATARNVTTTYAFYPYWDIAASLVAFPDNGVGAAGKTGSQVSRQQGDGRIALTPFAAMNAITPAAAGSGSGSTGGGKYF